MYNDVQEGMAGQSTIDISTRALAFLNYLKRSYHTEQLLSADITDHVPSEMTQHILTVHTKAPTSLDDVVWFVGRVIAWAECWGYQIVKEWCSASGKSTDLTYSAYVILKEDHTAFEFTFDSKPATSKGPAVWEIKFNTVKYPETSSQV